MAEQKDPTFSDEQFEELLQGLSPSEKKEAIAAREERMKVKKPKKKKRVSKEEEAVGIMDIIADRFNEKGKRKY